MTPQPTPKQQATDIAAQVWCSPECSHIVMNTDLAFAFAKVLEPLLEDKMRLDWLSDEENTNSIYVHDSPPKFSMRHKVLSNTLREAITSAMQKEQE